MPSIRTIRTIRSRWLTLLNWDRLQPYCTKCGKRTFPIAKQPVVMERTRKPDAKAGAISESDSVKETV